MLNAPKTGRAALMLLTLAVGALGCAPPSERPGSEPTAGEEEGFEAWDQEQPAPEGRASAIETLGLTPPETPWAEMSAHDREWYMVGKVDPIMAELFAGHDAARFAEFTCENCHGADMREVAFAMPSPSMYRIPAQGTPAFDAMLESFGPMVSFMAEEVTPKMSAIMGVEMSCASCHPSDAAR